MEVLPYPQPAELACLRDLQARTRAAHAGPVHISLPS
jgi:hypothetical protein